jgi:hypothetical protein
VGKDELFAGADVLTVHLVLSDRTPGLVGRDELKQMKQSAILINTSRGPIVDEAALLDVLPRGGRERRSLPLRQPHPRPHLNGPSARTPSDTHMDHPKLLVNT